jgi:hypothetical protein
MSRLSIAETTAGFSAFVFAFDQPAAERAISAATPNLQDLHAGQPS